MSEEKAIKSYKGFNKDMTCRGFQYEEGRDYETDKAEACETGFHACEYPLDCFGYYAPASSEFHVVEQGGELSRHGGDSKVASTKIHIGAKISIAGMVKAAIEFTTSRIKPEANSDEKYGASSATGSCGASSATGCKGASSATGYYGASSATGDYGASSATGSCGASVVTGYQSVSYAGNETAIAVAWGVESSAKGIKGATLVLSEWVENDEGDYVLKGTMLVRVDGETIKEDVAYTLKDGKVVEA